MLPESLAQRCDTLNRNEEKNRQNSTLKDERKLLQTELHTLHDFLISLSAAEISSQKEEYSSNWLNGREDER